jgi:Cu/Ag efflux protein CusF
MTLVVLSAAFAGCSADRQKGSEDKQYEVKGRVVSVADDRKSVTLDHEDIPGLMKAMKGMKFRVEDAKVLEGIGPGDEVKGHLKVTSGEQVIVHLEKAGSGVKQTKEEKVKANLAKLSDEDRRLAEAQKYCAVEQDNLLGSMGKPYKLVLKGQAVFLCCKGCEEEARAAPDKTLARVKELREKNAKPEK